jgi:hypothetical protein
MVVVVAEVAAEVAAAVAGAAAWAWQAFVGVLAAADGTRGVDG